MAVSLRFRNSNSSRRTFATVGRRASRLAVFTAEERTGWMHAPVIAYPAGQIPPLPFFYGTSLVGRPQKYGEG